MERVIKFRVWDGNKFDFSPTIWDGRVWNDLEDREIKGVELMQFTGLLDKNGVEIYEGDIVKTGTDKNMVVCWSERHASFMIEREGWMFRHYFGEAFESNECEVIGNIYENPNLIK